MREKPLHSFAVLAYKNSPYLEECLRSLVSQTRKSEVYIATSTPSKYIQKLADKYSCNLYVNQNSSGIASDWNFAFSRCKTPYLTLAHQDDIYLPEYTASLFNNKKIENSLITFTDYSELLVGTIRENTANLLIKKILRLPFLFSGELSSKFYKRFILSFGSPIPCPSVMYNTLKLKDFRFSGEFSINMDWAAWLELSRKEGSFVFERKKLFLHRIHQGSETTKGITDRRRWNEDKRIFAMIWPSWFAKILVRLYSLSYQSNHWLGSLYKLFLKQY